MAAETAQHYLRDLGYLLRERAEEAKAKAQRAEGSEADRAFESGRLMAYYEVTSLMRNQAEVFDLPLKDLALDGFEPQGLLGSPSH